MNGAEWGVVLGGLALIGWINWYFFLAGGARRRPTNAGALGARDGTPSDA